MSTDHLWSRFFAEKFPTRNFIFREMCDNGHYNGLNHEVMIFKHTHTLKIERSDFQTMCLKITNYLYRFARSPCASERSERPAGRAGELARSSRSDSGVNGAPTRLSRSDSGVNVVPLCEYRVARSVAEGNLIFTRPIKCRRAICNLDATT